MHFSTCGYCVILWKHFVFIYLMLISLLFYSLAEGSREFEESRTGTISRPGINKIAVTCGLSIKREIKINGYCQVLFLRVYIEVLLEVYKLASVALAEFRARVRLFWLRSRERKWRSRGRIGEESSRPRWKLSRSPALASRQLRRLSINSKKKIMAGRSV